MRGTLDSPGLELVKISRLDAVILNLHKGTSNFPGGIPMDVFGMLNPKCLPKTAGLARLHFTKEGEPKREGANILLPANDHSTLYLVEDGEQFIFRHRVNGYGNGRTWFGGTDEQPFLAQLNDRAWEAFKNFGYEGFIIALVPGPIIELKRRLGLPWQRQGDFFATPVPEELSTLEKLESLVLGRRVEARTLKNEPLNETRHRFSGYRLSFTALLGMERPTVYQGQLEAPDHQPLELKTPHLLLQASGLADPQRAD